jgi:hypothetical protein
MSQFSPQTILPKKEAFGKRLGKREEDWLSLKYELE